MSFYLLDRKPARESFYRTRKAPILAVVVHVTAGLQGRPHGADSSAERTAEYARTVTDRRVSWHSGSDRDSHLRLLPDGYTAFHCRGANSVTIGHEISKRDTSWRDEDDDWVTGTLQQAADCLRLRVRAHGIPLRRATVAELNYARANNGDPVGFLAHSDLDPARRSDPGADFPWDRFLALLRPATQEDDIVTPEDIEKIAQRTRQVIADGQQRYGLDNLYRMLTILLANSVTRRQLDAALEGLPADVVDEIRNRLSKET